MASRSSIIRALRRGQKLARLGRLGESLVAFDAAGDSNDVQLLVQHALILARAGQMEAALEKSAKAVALARDDVVPAVFNAYLMLRSGRLDEADGELQRAAKLSPENPIVPSLSAALDILRGSPAKGCRRLLAGPVTDNLDILGWALATVERTVFEAVGTDSGAIPPDVEGGEESDKPPDAVPAQSAGACAKRGEKLLEAGKPRTAAMYLERAVELKPDDAERRAVYGAALFEAGEFERAEAQLAQAPTKGAMSGVAQFYRAATAYRLGQYERALELLDTLPVTGDAFLYREWFDYVRGMAVMALGRTDEAAGYLALFLDVEPELLERRLKKAIQILAESEPCSTSS